ncbi:MAG: BON domain-containing protein [Bacteriovoracia bacterium]
MNQYGRDQRDYIRFRESDSFDDGRVENVSDSTDGSFTHSRELGRYPGRNRFGEERIRHDSYQDEYGMKHSLEHGGKLNRWSDDLRSESAYENHSGKGPKGYQRSRESILEEANDILTRDFNLDATEIEVDVQGDILVLKGDVSSRRDKKLAELLVEEIPGISDVHNHINIRDADVEGWIPGIGHITEDEKRGENG